MDAIRLLALRLILLCHFQVLVVLLQGRPGSTAQVILAPQAVCKNRGSYVLERGVTREKVQVHQ